MRKVFEAIADLEFKPDDTMHAMMSVEGEKINFVKKVDPQGRNVEYWMGDVEKQMITSVRAKVAIANSRKLTPSIRLTLPKVKRGAPEVTSVPTVAIIKPNTVIIMALITWPLPEKAATAVKPRIIKAK